MSSKPSRTSEDGSPKVVVVRHPGDTIRMGLALVIFLAAGFLIWSGVDPTKLEQIRVGVAVERTVGLGSQTPW